MLISLSAYSESTCSKNGTTVIYTNGIDTNTSEANEALKLIKNKIKRANAKTQKKHIDKNNIEYEVAFNYDENFMLDVLESAVQKLPKSYIDTLKVTNAYDAYSYFLQGKYVEMIDAAIVKSIMTARLNAMAELATNYANVDQYNRTIGLMSLIYNKAILKKHRIFAISHSQGSLYMRDIQDSNAVFFCYELPQ